MQLPESSRAATAAALAHRTGITRVADPPPQLGDAMARIARHLANGCEDLADLPLDYDGVTPFRRRVYEAARAVGPGEVVSYFELARRVDSSGAARAVGQAMAHNPFSIVVPCHRVVAAGTRAYADEPPDRQRARLCGFTAHGGVDTKAWLLALEANASKSRSAP